MTSTTYFLLFFISWQQFKATPHSCVLLCMMKNRWGTQIYKLLKPISISSLVARAGLEPSGVSLMCRHGAGGGRGRRGHSWHCRVIYRHSDTYSPCQNITVKGSPLRLSNKNKPPGSNCLAASQHTLWPLSLSLLMRLAFSTLGEILTNIFDKSYHFTWASVQWVKCGQK